MAETLLHCNDVPWRRFTALCREWDDAPVRVALSKLTSRQAPL
jgi:hypothetical protein